MDLLQVEGLAEVCVPDLHDERSVEVQKVIPLVILGRLGVHRLEVFINLVFDGAGRFRRSDDADLEFGEHIVS